MALARDGGICVRKFEYSETSQILTLFTRGHGLIRLIAKGAHRRTKAGASKFDGGVDLLDRGAAVFTHRLGRDLDTLTEWNLLEGHLHLRRDLRGLYLAQYAAELIAALIEEHDPHEPLYDRFERLLADLGTARQEEAFLHFELDLLRDSGYLADLSNCTECGRAPPEREATFFSAARGGIVCRDCESATPDRRAIDTRLMRLANGVMRLPRSNGVAQRLPKLTRHQTDPLNRMLADHIEHTSGKPLRMPRWTT